MSRHCTTCQCFREERACQRCGTTFEVGTGKYVNAIYCTRRCAKLAATQAWRDRQREAVTS